MDALRADHLSCYGYTRETTPNIDEIAATGIRYSRCFSPATWTKPASASILTGAYPPVHGMRTREDTFVTDIPRLPELLSKRGFTTAGFSTMGNVSKSLGYGRGFDEYYDLYKNPDIVEKRATTSADSEELEHESADKIALPRAEDLTAEFTEWLEQTDDDFFAFMWSIEPHIPYNPPEDYRGFIDSTYEGPVDGERETLPEVETEEDLSRLKRLYDGEIKYNDDEIGQIVSALKQKGEYEDTLLIIAGDHGDAFNEHGRLTHGHLPYDELIHVPLILKPPNGKQIVKPEITEITSLVDICPTIADAAGINSIPDTVQGRSLPPFGKEGSSSPVFSETRSRDIYPAFYSIRTERWKYMCVDNPDRSFETALETLTQLYERGIIVDILRNPRYYLSRYLHSEDEFLFDLEKDTLESENLVSEEFNVASELRENLQTWLEDGERIHKSLSETGRIDIDSGTDEQLRKLGYLD